MSERFMITEQHLKLLKRAYVGWDDREFGAPAIDCKRPYGNSDVYGDIAEILGIPRSNRDEDDEFSDDDMARMDIVHRSMKTVLEVGFSLLKFEVGTYEKVAWKTWKKID